MLTAIIIMLWLLTSALCAVGGYFYAMKDKKHNKLSQKTNNLSEEDAKKQKRASDELSNFYKYDGTEQG